MNVDLERALLCTFFISLFPNRMFSHSLTSFLSLHPSSPYISVPPPLSPWIPPYPITITAYPPEASLTPHTHPLSLWIPPYPITITAYPPEASLT